MTKKQSISLAFLVTICIIIIAITDMIIKPPYIIKTCVKAPIFFFIPILYSKFYKCQSPFKFLKSNLQGLKIGLFLGIFIYSTIVITYLIANSLTDLSTIKTSLENNLGINAKNFFAIGLYVALVNSFLEEWFFRGFIFTEYKKHSRFFAYIMSSLSFSIYHIAIMDGMFNIFLQILVLLGLFIGGTIFNYLNEKNENIYSSWFCHSFANFAMNTVGFIIFFT
ncbi:MAG: CPBP family intramembrane glutamic endopeptidase [Clostridia bacterium]